ncbi:MAG: hypothetical protein ACT4QD_16880 [Acidobacteriota bacterium]
MLTDWFSRRTNPRADTKRDVEAQAGAAQEPIYPTKALAKFLKPLASCDSPVLIDLGPVVGSNVSYFGERLACRIRVEDLPADVDRHVREGRLAELPAQFRARFPQPAESVDGILCWDVLDFLDRPAAQALAGALTRLLRPDGVLLGFFSTVDTRVASYTKYVVVTDTMLKYRHYPAARARQRSLLNRDIIKLFEGLRVTDSFLMKNNLREILFRKPADPSR